MITVIDIETRLSFHRSVFCVEKFALVIPIGHTTIPSEIAVYQCALVDGGTLLTVDVYVSETLLMHRAVDHPCVTLIGIDIDGTPPRPCLVV